MVHSFLYRLRRGRADNRIKNSRINETRVIHRVFHTYELLEAVLLHFSPYQLRQARLVSKTWLAVIERSQGLKDVWKTHPRGGKVRLAYLQLLGDQGVGKLAFIDKVLLVILATSYRCS